MKASKILTGGLITGLVTSPFAYSQEQSPEMRECVKQYEETVLEGYASCAAADSINWEGNFKSGDNVYMVGKEKADKYPTMVDGIKKLGGIETKVAGDSLWINVESEQNRTLIPNQTPQKKSFWNSKTFKWFVLPTAGLMGTYFIADQVSKHNDKGKQNTPKNDYNLPEDPADVGVGGGRTDEGSVGGSRTSGSVGGSRQ